MQNIPINMAYVWLIKKKNTVRFHEQLDFKERLLKVDNRLAKASMKVFIATWTKERNKIWRKRTIKADKSKIMEQEKQEERTAE